MAVDYINNLKDPAAFQRMVSRLSEISSYQKLSNDKKEALLQRLASNREQKAALVGEPKVSSGTSISSDGESTMEAPSGVASEASGARALEGLQQLVLDTGQTAALTGGAAMALGGLELDQALEVALNPTTIGRGVLSAIPDIMQSGMGIGRDLGFAGHVGKGILSLALGAVNPALGALASAVGTTVADAAMDWMDARGFEEQKDRLENYAGELGARSGIDYAQLEDFEAQGVDTTGKTFGEIRDELQDQLDNQLASGAVSPEKAAIMQAEIDKISPFADFEDKVMTMEEYSLEISRSQPNVDRLNELSTKLRGMDVDPTKIAKYTPLEGYDAIFGRGAYDRATQAAKERTKRRNLETSAKMFKESVEDHQLRRQVAKEIGSKTITGSAVAQAMMDKKRELEAAKEKEAAKERKRQEAAKKEQERQQEAARREQERFDKWKDRNRSEGGSYDPRGGPVGGSSGGRHDSKKGISWGGSGQSSSKSKKSRRSSRNEGGNGFGGGSGSGGDRQSSPGGMGGV